ncbi:MAG: pirin family protein [Campylobacterales bacterium]|nr:pirin family protein [Campylobacterales bacterium]
MIRIHPHSARGSADHGWLQSRFSFSFDRYVDRARMGYGPLRVINDDIIAQGGGFGMHPHRDMEIITVVIEGQLEHADDQGHRGIIGRDEVQFMRAGSGIVHSERNAGETPLHLFQIWISPKTKGLSPAYEQRRFDAFEQRGTCVRLVGEGGIAIDQDASIDSLILEPKQRIVLEAPAA